MAGQASARYLMDYSIFMQYANALSPVKYRCGIRRCVGFCRCTRVGDANFIVARDFFYSFFNCFTLKCLSVKYKLLQQ